MPRSSRHRSHKEKKHSSKEARDYSDSEEDVRMRERESKDGEVSVRVSKELASGEKRKKDSDNSSGNGNGNGDAGEELVLSKRRKEKAEGAGGGGADRWNGGGNGRGGDSLAADKEIKGGSSKLDFDRGSKAKESKISGDLKGKSSRRADGFGEKKEDNLSSVHDKDDSRSGVRVDSRRKSEKDSSRRESNKDVKELKDKERGLERERKVQDTKRDADARADGELAKKQRSQSVDVRDDRQGKGGRENTDWNAQDELQNPEFEKDTDRRTQRRVDSLVDEEKFLDDARGNERRLSSKDGKYKDERHRDRSHGNQYKEAGEKDGRHRDDKSHDDVEKENRHKDVKHREDGEKYHKHRDDKTREDGDKVTKRRDDKYREDGDRDNRHRDDNYREEGDRDHKYSDNKYDDGDRDHKPRDNKYHEDGDKEKGRSFDRYRDDIKRDDRHREDKYKEGSVRDNKHKEEKHREDMDRDGRYWDVSPADDVDREKRLRDVRYREERSSRDRSNDKSDTKRMRDDSNAVDYYRKSSNRDDSPSYEKRSVRYKEDQGKRRAIDKDEHGDSRFRSNKEERADTDKRSTSTKVDGVTDRGRSSSRHVDLELNFNHGRRRASPCSSSYALRDYYRVSKHEEPKYRDQVNEDKADHNAIGARENASSAGANEKISARLVERHMHMDDSYFGEMSAEKRQNLDVRASPLGFVDKSPTSNSTDRRHMNRSDARRSLDVEDTRQRSGSRDAKEGRGSRELPLDVATMDEFSQADGDNLSVSSPFPRSSHFSGNSRSRFPPHPFRIGLDSPFAFGSSEDDGRSKSSNRHRRNDPNIGRLHGNAWKGLPNWTPPVANGFMPFQHGPPPVNFHPMMQQFPAPPLFGVRPPMDLNHTGVPYHMPDADRFSGHGRPLGWRNPVDESCPPPMHVWDSNNSVFGDESHPYNRLDWDPNRGLLNNRGRETSVDAWKEQNSVLSVDVPSPQKELHAARGTPDEIWTSQLAQQAPKEQNQSDSQDENVDIGPLSDISEVKTLDAPNAISEQSPILPESSAQEDASLYHIYLSNLDISEDLTQPELFAECANLLDLNHNEVSGAKILFVESVVEAKVMLPRGISISSSFPAISESIYQKAMSLYQKQREEFKVVSGKTLPFFGVQNFEVVPTSGQGADSSNGKAGEVVPGCSCDAIKHTMSVSEHGKEAAPINDQIVEEFSETSEKFNSSPECVEKSEVPVPTLGEVNLPTSGQKTEEPTAILEVVNTLTTPITNEEKLEHSVEEENIPKEIIEDSAAISSHMMENTSTISTCGGNYSAAVNNGQKCLETKCGGQLPSDVFSEACEAVVLESIESESVNLSRIHHSLENTH